MDWNIVYSKLAPIVAGFVLIMIAYYLPKSLLKRDRKDKKEKASVIDIIWAALVTLGCCSMFAGYLSYEKESAISYFIVWFLVSAIPSSISLIAYFKRDSKLSITDRIADQITMDKEELEASKYETN